MTATPRLVITSDGAGVITFTEADGHSMRFVPNDRTEKHQLTAGTVESKTKWEKDQLLQEIAIPGGPKLVRVFVVQPENKQLTVTTTMEGGSRAPPDREQSVRFVYDADAER